MVLQLIRQSSHISHFLMVIQTYGASSAMVSDSLYKDSLSYSVCIKCRVPTHCQRYGMCMHTHCVILIAKFHYRITGCLRYLNLFITAAGLTLGTMVLIMIALMSCFLCMHVYVFNTVRRLLPVLKTSFLRRHRVTISKIHCITCTRPSIIGYSLHVL